MTASASPALAIVAAVRALLDEVCDPEIPNLTIADLGILREVRSALGRVTVAITPTYSGCPAMHAIADDIRRVLDGAGYADVVIETRLAPAWTTAWLTPAAHAKLRAIGIAPPAVASSSKRALLAANCPRCGSGETELISEFSATACKALYRCASCLEPFDYFKCL